CLCRGWRAGRARSPWVAGAPESRCERARRPALGRSVAPCRARGRAA
ncbi:MAG: hypothetical protein AVDCRST_MAG90-2001, partial [uncultured Microvirga sp.]